MPGLAQLPPEVRSLRPVKALERNLHKGRLAHAILLKGEDLSQLQQVADALAASLLQISGNPATHPDYFTLRPAGKSRAIKVGKRGHDEPNSMRSLVNDLHKTSNQGGYKVALLLEADRLNPAAANAFLKTLEEPPAKTVILLLTTRPYELLDTIRSRCFQFRLPARLSPPRDPAWRAWLDDYRQWIQWLHLQPDQARAHPDRAFLTPYGLITRFLDITEALSEKAWSERAQSLPPNLGEEELDALRVGHQKGLRDQQLIHVEEATRIAAIELSHKVPFPAAWLARAIASLESITGLLALNMKDETALEAFFLDSLRIWTTPR